MNALVTAAITVFLSLLAGDYLWLSTSFTKLYKPKFESLFTFQFSVLPAILFYVFYAIAASYFVVLPALKEPLLTVFLRGLFFGFICYATYDLTNMATIKNWPLNVTLIDLAWGSFLTAVCCTIAVLVVKRLVAV